MEGIEEHNKRHQDEIISGSQYSSGTTSTVFQWKEHIENIKGSATHNQNETGTKIVFDASVQNWGSQQPHHERQAGR